MIANECMVDASFCLVGWLLLLAAGHSIETLGIAHCCTQSIGLCYCAEGTCSSNNNENAPTRKRLFSTMTFMIRPLANVVV